MDIAIYKSQSFLNEKFNVVNFFSFKKNKLDFLSKINDHDVRSTRFSVGHEKLVFIKEPSDIKGLLLLDNKYLDKNTPAYDGLRRYLGNGLLSSKNKDWSVQRKIANPFFQNQRINNYFPVFKKVVQRKVEESIHNKEINKQDLNLWVSDMTLSILGETILGMSLNSQSVDISLSFNKIFETTIKDMYHPMPAILGLKIALAMPYQRAKKKLNTVVSKLMKDNVKNEKRDHYVAHLQDFENSSGEKLSSTQIFDEIITMIQAGHETSSNALIWTLVHLQNSKNDQIRLIEELKSLPENYTIEELDSLKFLDACLLESLRLDPPAWAFDRRVTENIEINGLKLNKNDIVVFSPYFTHRLSTFWENPNEFQPERFLNKNMNISDGYFPFGFGPRFCIGQRFAMIELKTILVEIYLKIKMNIDDISEIKREGSITLRPNREIYFNIESL